MKIYPISKKKTKKDKSMPSQMEINKSVRKQMPPPTKVIPDKSKYDRKDKSWKKDI